MGKNPFTDRPEESKNLEMLKLGQRVLIVEKHRQGVRTKEELTEGYIQGFLTSKPFHPQGIKVSVVRQSYIEGKNIYDIDQSIKKYESKIGTKSGGVDVNQYAIGRVQYLVETEDDIQEGDIVQITKTKRMIRETDLMEGVVFNIIQFELVEGKSKAMVEFCDGSIGWVQKIVFKMEC